MSHGYFIFRFTNAKDLDRVLLDGLWSLDDAMLALGAWTLEFQSSAGLIPWATFGCVYQSSLLLYGTDPLWI